MRRALLLGCLALAASPAGCARKKQPPAASRLDAATPPSYEAGKAALEGGRLDDAEAIFRAVAEGTPRPGEDPALRDNALLALASVRKERGDGKGALAYAQKVVDHRPDDEDALTVLVEVAHEVGDLPAEIAAREKLVALDPDALDQRLMLAGALTAAKELERGKAAFLGYEDARVRIIAALGKSPDPGVRQAAARALAAAHDGGTARALVFAMTDKDPKVRAEAVRSVASVGIDLDPEIRPALKKLQTIEQDPDVLGAIMTALLPIPAK